MKRILSILSVAVMLVTMCAAITLPAVAETATNGELVNLFDINTATPGTVTGQSTSLYYTTDYIDVVPGDVLYFGINDIALGYQMYLYTADSDKNSNPVTSPSGTNAGKDNYRLCEILDSFPMPNDDNNRTWGIMSYTIPEGFTRVRVTCRVTFADQYLLTKNRPFTNEERMAYFGLDSFTTNLFTARETKGYYAKTGEITSSSNYYSGELISMNAGDTVYFGPYDLSTTQNFYGYFWEGTDFSTPTQLKKDYVVDGTLCSTAITFPNGQVVFAYTAATAGQIGIVAHKTNIAMFVASKNIPLTAENLYEYWDLHSDTITDYSSIVGRYDNVVPKESPLNGKSALFTGDSICAAAADDNYFNDLKLGGWSGRIKMNYGLAYTINNGVSGAAFSTTRDNYWNAATSTNRQQGRIYWQLTREKDYQYDYVILHGGTNDAWDPAPAGKISDSFEVEDFDLSTYAGGLEAAIYYAVKYQPQAAIGYVLNFEMPYKTSGNIPTLGETYFELGKQICEKWNIPYLDLYSILNAETFDTNIYTKDSDTPNAAGYMKDAVHPNAAGYNIIAPYIGDWMETLSPYSTPAAKENDKTVIACVGDSLTKGEKSGDVNRYSYPAYLQEMLGDEYEVMNFGRGGAAAQTTASNTYKATVQYNRSIDANPDKVVIMLGTNDARTDNGNWDSADHATSCAEYKADLKALVEEYMNLPSNPAVYLATPPYINRESYLTIYNDGGLLAAVREIADELDIQLIDNYTPTNGRTDLFAEGDTAHFTAAGYELIAGEVYKALTNQTTAPDVLSILEKDTAVEETNPAKPLIRNWNEYYDTVDSFRIETVEDVVIFGDLIAAGKTFAGKTVYLENDLDFTGMDFKPLGGSSGKSADTDSYIAAFAGIFDGQNHVFSNVNISSLYYNTALFPVCNGATIQNFGLDGGRIEGFSTVASLVGLGHNAPKLYNVWSSADVYSAYRAGITAGIIAYCGKDTATTDAELINVAYYGNVDGTSTIGGICAELDAASIVKNVVFGGTVTQRGKHSGGITPFSIYNSFTITGATSGLYTVDTAEERNTSTKKNNVITLNISFSTVTPVKFTAADFKNGGFAYYMNNLEGNDTKWIMKHGYAVPWGDEDTAIVKIQIDGKDAYSNENSGFPADILAKGSYWYGTDGKVYSSENAKDWIFDEGDAIKIAISAAGADFNNNGGMDTADVIMLLKYVDRISVEGMTDTLADVNADGKATLFDAIKLMQVLNDLAA